MRWTPCDSLGAVFCLYGIYRIPQKNKKTYREPASTEFLGKGRTVRYASSVCTFAALSSNGSPTWARTRDLRINSPSLYRLSYRGIVLKKAAETVLDAALGKAHILKAQALAVNAGTQNSAPF